MGLAVSPTAVILVIWSLGQNDSELSKSSTIYKYLIFIYSEQMTHSENENDHFDLDHLDHILVMLSCRKDNGLKSQPAEYQDQLL